MVHSPGTQMIADFLTKFSISGEKFRTMAESITYDPTTDNNAIKPHPRHVLQPRDTGQKHRDDGTGSTSNTSKVHTLRAPCQKNANKDKGIQTIENDERTTKAHKNPNGHSDRKENTNDDDKENYNTCSKNSKEQTQC